MPKDEGGLGLIDKATQGSILKAKQMVHYIKGSSPWHVLLRQRLLIAQHIGKIQGTFDLCDIISAPWHLRMANLQEDLVFLM